MQTNIPDFKKYFPNCAAAHPGVCTQRSDNASNRSQVSDAVSVGSHVVVCQEPPVSPALVVPGRLDEACNLRPRALSIASPNRKLIWLCVLGWVVAGIGFSLWLFH